MVIRHDTGDPLTTSVILKTAEASSHELYTATRAPCRLITNWDSFSWRAIVATVFWNDSVITESESLFGWLQQQYQRTRHDIHYIRYRRTDLISSRFDTTFYIDMSSWKVVTYKLATTQKVWLLWCPSYSHINCCTSSYTVRRPDSCASNFHEIVKL